jgi:hypothetical protein
MFSRVFAPLILLNIFSLNSGWSDESNSAAIETPPECCDRPPACCVTPCSVSPNYSRSFEKWEGGVVKAEALYWMASADGLDCSFGTSSIIDLPASDGVLTATVNEKDENADFKWRWGFRVGTGYEESCSGWNFSAFWTHINGLSNGPNRVSNGGRWNLRYNVIDAVVGRDFWVSSCFLFKPFLGLRGAEIQEHVRSHFETNFTNSSGTSVILSNLKAKQRFWGLGPELGVEANWYWGTGFSLVGNLGLALMYGHFDIRSKSTDFFQLSSNISNLHRQQVVVISGVDALLGVRWETFFACQNMSLALQLSGEHHSLINFNQIGEGDLNLDGGTFSVAFHF